MKPPLLSIRDIRKYFPQKVAWPEEKGRSLPNRMWQSISRKQAQVRAVDGVSLDIVSGETLGLVGESGCGKSTLGRTILRLLEPNSGTIEFEGKQITGLSQAEMRPLRQRMQIIFQDPYASLNPRMRVGEAIAEGLTIFKLESSEAAKNQRVSELLEKVGLPKDSARRFPHEFSGGQRQRIGIARALALRPKLIVCDEAVSALDVSIQAQIINLLMDLQKSEDLTYLFISHDLNVVRHICDRVAVMYLGKIVELAPTERLFTNPSHPYTKALLSALPCIGSNRKRERIVLTGDVPSAIDPPKGCAFHPRCPVKDKPEACFRDGPELSEIHPSHHQSCHLQ